MESKTPVWERATEVRNARCPAERMVGKTIARVEYGKESAVPGAHRARALVLHFTDGSRLDVTTESNAAEVTAEVRASQWIAEEDFRVELDLRWE